MIKNFQRHLIFSILCVCKQTNGTRKLYLSSLKEAFTFSRINPLIMSKSIHNIRDILLQELEFSNISNCNVVLIKML